MAPRGGDRKNREALPREIESKSQQRRRRGFGAAIEELFPGAKLTKTTVTYQLSDHFPAWLQIKTDIDGERFDQIVQNGRKE